MPADQEEKTYYIKRHYKPGVDKENEIVAEGLTLKEAQAHCCDPSTATEEYFDGYYAE